MATAKTKSQMRLQRSWPGPHGPERSCSCGVKASRPSISSTPAAMPATTSRAPPQGLSVRRSAASSAGSSSEKKAAASIIPAAAPSRTSSSRCGMERSTTTGKAPAVVAAKPTRPP